MEPTPRFTETQFDQILGELQRFEEMGYRLPVPRFSRAEGQSTAEIVLAATMKPAPAIIVACAVRLVGQRHSMCVTVAENIPGKTRGRSEISITLPQDRGERGFFSHRFGKDASDGIRLLANRLGDLDRIAAVDNQRLDRDQTIGHMSAVAGWISSLVRGR